MKSLYYRLRIQKSAQLTYSCHFGFSDERDGMRKFDQVTSAGAPLLFKY